jgi:hypothetical protein
MWMKQEQEVKMHTLSHHNSKGKQKKPLDMLSLTTWSHIYMEHVNNKTNVERYPNKYSNHQ